LVERGRRQRPLSVIVTPMASSKQDGQIPHGLRRVFVVGAGLAERSDQHPGGRGVSVAPTVSSLRVSMAGVRGGTGLDERADRSASSGTFEHALTVWLDLDRLLGEQAACSLCSEAEVVDDG
jgi:hypothetical protein